MESLGYVTLERRAENRKNIYVFLTPLGRTLNGILVPLAEEVNAIALKDVPASDVAATRRCLLSAIENLSLDEMC
jgi:DNA-binding MarR family transcriptional regulator